MQHVHGLVHAQGSEEAIRDQSTQAGIVQRLKVPLAIEEELVAPPGDVAYVEVGEHESPDDVLR